MSCRFIGISIRNINWRLLVSRITLFRTHVTWKRDGRGVSLRDNYEVDANGIQKLPVPSYQPFHPSTVGRLIKLVANKSSVPVMKFPPFTLVCKNTVYRPHRSETNPTKESTVTVDRECKTTKRMQVLLLQLVGQWIQFFWTFARQFVAGLKINNARQCDDKFSNWYQNSFSNGFEINFFHVRCKLHARALDVQLCSIVYGTIPVADFCNSKFMHCRGVEMERINISSLVWN